MTLDQATEFILARWTAQWIVGSAERTPFVFENEDDEDLDNGSVSWASVIVVETGGGQETLGGAGSRKFRRKAMVSIEIRTPKDSGSSEASTLAHAARTIYEATSFDGLDFNNARVVPLGKGEKWTRHVVEADFEFTEEK